LTLALIMLLALQLLMGWQSQATAAAAAAAAHADCPMHDGLRGAAQPAGTGKHGPSKHLSEGGHDCCHATACQCHCVQTPSSLELLALNDVATCNALPAFSTAPLVAPRIDDFLRPPIA